MPEQLPVIFVSIAAYCDPALPWTLDDCLRNARYPQRLRFGICWQNDPRRPVDLRRFRSDRRFAFTDYDIGDSGGGCWARSISQSMWRGEAYILQIDSHMAFSPGWDQSLVGMMNRLPSEKPLISTVLPLFWLDADGTVRRQTDIGVCSVRIENWKEQSGWAPWFVPALRVNDFPARSRFLSGGFVFTLGRWADEVRQDPDHYYWGEEFALTLRSFTHGYDLFLPDEIVVWHMWHRQAPPRRHWEKGLDVVADKNAVAFERLRKLAFSREPADGAALGRYGLGSRRTLADYEAFAGIDLDGKRAHPDVYIGKCPAPVTIRCAKDWDSCLTSDDWSKAQQLR